MIPGPCLTDPPPKPEPVIWKQCAPNMECLDLDNAFKLARNVEELELWVKVAWTKCKKQ